MLLLGEWSKCSCNESNCFQHILFCVQIEAGVYGYIYTISLTHLIYIPSCWGQLAWTNMLLLSNSSASTTTPNSLMENSPWNTLIPQLWRLFTRTLLGKEQECHWPAHGLYKKTCCMQLWEELLLLQQQSRKFSNPRCNSFLPSPSLHLPDFSHIQENRICLLDCSQVRNSRRHRLQRPCGE